MTALSDCITTGSPLPSGPRVAAIEKSWRLTTDGSTVPVLHFQRSATSRILLDSSCAMLTRPSFKESRGHLQNLSAYLSHLHFCQPLTLHT